MDNLKTQYKLEINLTPNKNNKYEWCLYKYEYNNKLNTPYAETIASGEEYTFSALQSAWHMAYRQIPDTDDEY